MTSGERPRGKRGRISGKRPNLASFHYSELSCDLSKPINNR